MDRPNPFRPYLMTAFSLSLASFVFGCQPNPKLDKEDRPELSSDNLAVKNGWVASRLATLDDGKTVEVMVINGPPKRPAGFDTATASADVNAAGAASGSKILDVPAYGWFMGCSATSAAMIAAYYDRNGFDNMYTGTTNGGVMPVDSSVWPTWTDGAGAIYEQHPLAASHNGLDGRTTRGSIDDYWVAYQSNATDPFTGHWTQHTYGDAIGDYMKTSQSGKGNVDGSTQFVWPPNDGSRGTCDAMGAFGRDVDGTYGIKLFYEARGYVLSECYHQYTDNKKTGGFSFANYQAEINAGRPVFLNVNGHSMVGVGYDSVSNTVYLHDTWDYEIHTMPWGGSYSGMELYAVSIVNLVPRAPTEVTASDGEFTDKVRVSWNAPIIADSFQVYRNGTNSSVGATLLGSSSAPPYDDTSATPGSPYYYFVKGCHAGSCGVFSALAAGRMSAGGPTPPAVTASDGTYPDKVQVSWTASNGAVSYKVYRNTSNSSGSAVLLGSPAASPYDDASATPGVTYYYFVKGCTSVSCGNISTSDSGYRPLIAPLAPKDLSASDGSYGTEVRVSWTASELATSYQIFRNTYDASSGAIQIATASTSPYSDTAPGAGVVQYYFVKACNSAGCSDFSSSNLGYRGLPNATYDSTLKAPKCGTGKICDSGTLLVGRASLGPEPNYPNTLAKSTCADGTAGTFHVDESIERLQIVSLDGTNLAPGKYARIDATVWAFSTSKDYLDLYLTTDASATTPVWTLLTPDFLHPSTSGGAVVISQEIILPATGGTLWAIRGNYRYSTSSISHTSCSTGNYDDHDDLVFVVDAAAPSPPTNVTASDGTYTDKVQVSWTASSGATSYQVFRNTSDSHAGATQIATPGASPYDDTTATPGTTYTYFVKACTTGGCGIFSASDVGYRATSNPEPDAGVDTGADSGEDSGVDGGVDSGVDSGENSDAEIPVAGGWTDHNGVPAVMVQDPNAPSGGPVQKVDRPASGGDYFSPSIAVTAGQTYCVAADIKWVGGSTPFIGILRDNAVYLEWLIGSAYTDAFGPTTVVDPASTGWQHLTRELVMPAGTTRAHLALELYGGGAKAGDSLAYFDGVSITAGACPIPAGWVDRSGIPAVMVADPNSPSGGSVHKVDRAASGGDYFSPPNAVTAGQTYCVAADIKWVGGGTPFIGILRSNTSNVEWLIGSAYTDAFGPTTVIDPANTGWQHLTHDVLIPTGTTQVKLVNELYGGITKTGDSLAYFDGVSIIAGSCTAWRDKSGIPAVMLPDPNAPSGGPVHMLDRPASGGDYFSPPSAVTAGQTYCVAADIKWLGGGTPFIGILRSNASNVEWLIGSAYTDAFGPTAVVDPGNTGWQHLTREIVMPAGTTQVKLANELFSGVTKAGADLAYFDRVSISSGVCTGWVDKSGIPAVMVPDPIAPSGGPVQKIDRAVSGGDYFSPMKAVTAGQSYCVAADIKWVSGGTPFIGILRSNAGTVEWLMGSSYTDAFGPTTVVDSTCPGWQHLTHSIVMPAGTTQVRLANELFDGVTKPGSNLAYFDGVAITPGTCASLAMCLP